jgi:hypothetical protein
MPTSPTRRVEDSKTSSKNAPIQVVRSNMSNFLPDQRSRIARPRHKKDCLPGCKLCIDDDKSSTCNTTCSVPTLISHLAKQHLPGMNTFGKTSFLFHHILLHHGGTSFSLLPTDTSIKRSTRRWDD